jgi:hypothetical protein
MLKNELDILKASLKESIGDVDPEDLPYYSPVDDVWGTLRYETHNDDETISLANTHKVGELHGVSFNDLVNYFGRPMSGQYDSDHNVNWYIEFADHQVAEIYDRHQKGERAENITSWRIAGKSYEVTARIDLILKGKGRRGFGPIETVQTNEAFGFIKNVFNPPFKNLDEFKAKCAKEIHSSKIMPYLLKHSNELKGLGSFNIPRIQNKFPSIPTGKYIIKLHFSDSVGISVLPNVTGVYEDKYYITYYPDFGAKWVSINDERTKELNIVLYDDKTKEPKDRKLPRFIATIKRTLDSIDPSIIKRATAECKKSALEKIEKSRQDTQAISDEFQPE